MTTIARKFIVREDELDEPTEERQPIARAPREPRVRPDWIVVASFGRIGCLRCGATRSLMPPKDEPFAEYARGLRAFAKSHGDCKPRT
jgi:hypothetical protein